MGEERERQFREEVPEFREVDIGQRAVRVLARLRGMAPPSADVRWDDLAAAARVAPEEVDAVVDAYSGAFVDRMRPVADANDTLARLAADGFALAILSNWPLATTIDRFAAAQGWLPYLRRSSCRNGSARSSRTPPSSAPPRAGFGATRRGMTGRAPILHVGDDWAADVVGAARAGWRTAYLRNRQADSPLPPRAGRRHGRR